MKKITGLEGERCIIVDCFGKVTAFKDPGTRWRRTYRQEHSMAPGLEDMIIPQGHTEVDISWGNIPIPLAAGLDGSFSSIDDAIQQHGLSVAVRSLSPAQQAALCKRFREVGNEEDALIVRSCAEEQVFGSHALTDDPEKFMTQFDNNFGN